MGRITGVSPAETRERLLRAAAAAFQAQGYEGTRVADIASGAGVSNGALYSHFGSKTELLAEALRAHGSTELASLFLDDPDRSVIDLLVTVGRGLVERSPDHGALVVEARVAARRDGEVAEMMGGDLRRRDNWLAARVQDGQAEGAVDPALAPEVVSRYCLMLLLGSILLPAAGLPPVDGDDWAALIDRMGQALRPEGSS
jgi:AcrR family transcriptional regulator